MSMNGDDINKYLPSILNPRGVRKQDREHSLTQNSIVSRCSLSLKKKNGSTNLNRSIQNVYRNNKENVQSNTKVTVLSQKTKNVPEKQTAGNRNQLPISCSLGIVPVFTSEKANNQSFKNTENGKTCKEKDIDPVSAGLAVKDIDLENNRNEALVTCQHNFKSNSQVLSLDFEECAQVVQNNIEANDNGVNLEASNKDVLNSEFEDFLSVEKEIEVKNNGVTVRPTNIEGLDLDFEDFSPVQNDIEVKDNSVTLKATGLHEEEVLDISTSTIVYQFIEKPRLSLSFGFNNCQSINISTNHSNIKNIVVRHKDNAMNVECVMEESSHISISDDEEDLNDDDGPSPAKRSAVDVNLKIKKKKSTVTATENSKVLILNTNAIKRLSHVIVQPPNYKLVKRQISDVKFKNNSQWKLGSVRYGKTVHCDNLKQKRIDCYFGENAHASKVPDGTLVESVENVVVACDDDEDMSRNLGVVAEAAKYDRSAHRTPKSGRREIPASPRPRPRNVESPKSQCVKNTTSEVPRTQTKVRNNSASSSPSPRKNVDSVQFSLPTKGLNKSSLAPKSIPYYKIVAGTHFAVDAFSYGDIPNVKHYFLTHFHSDHYSGLKKAFNKFLFCTKITADLCVSRLGVNPKCIHIINFDETLTVDGVDVTAVDANHCPGAMMLVFTLPNGKTMLHTGDFRASPHMESYPVFWNKDIHTIYLDSTYCNPRYDFPTQDQSLEMALYFLRQKKMSLEKAGKKFSSVLIVCGTYTIGKEKFFLGMARRVGCSVWACPEKDKVLQAVEGRSFSSAPPTACQLHVVPMRDLTHEKLRSYMDTLHGTFSEVVAFKPSGWENGKNSTVEKDQVTIHGIPYSEHSSFSEMIRFVKYIKPKQVVPTVDISGGVKAVQKYFPCPLVCKDSQSQSKVTDYFSIQSRQQVPAVT